MGEASYFSFTGGIPLANGRLNKKCIGCFVGDSTHLWMFENKHFFVSENITVNGSLGYYNPDNSYFSKYYPTGVKQYKKPEKIITDFINDSWEKRLCITNYDGTADVYTIDNLEVMFLIGDKVCMLPYTDPNFGVLSGGLQPLNMEVYDIENGEFETPSNIIDYSGFSWSNVWESYQRSQNNSWITYTVGGHVIRLEFPVGTIWDANEYSGEAFNAQKHYTGGPMSFNSSFSNLFGSVLTSFRYLTYSVWPISNIYVYEEEESTATIPPHQWHYAGGICTQAASVTVNYVIDDGMDGTTPVELNDDGNDYEIIDGQAGYAGYLYDAGTGAEKGIVNYSHNRIYLYDEPVYKPSVGATVYVNQTSHFWYTQRTESGLIWIDQSTREQDSRFHLNTSTGVLSLDFGTPSYEHPDLSENVSFTFFPDFDLYFDGVEIEDDAAKDYLIRSLGYYSYGLKYIFGLEGMVLFTGSGEAFMYHNDTVNGLLTIWSTKGTITKDSSGLEYVFYINDKLIFFTETTVNIFSYDAYSWETKPLNASLSLGWDVFCNYDGNYYYFYGSSGAVRLSNSLSTVSVLSDLADYNIYEIIGGICGKFMFSDWDGDYYLLATTGSKETIFKPETDDIVGIFGRIKGI